MAFDQSTRNGLAKTVGDCRRLLTEDIRKQLQGVYGLQPDGTALPSVTSMNGDEKSRGSFASGRGIVMPTRSVLKRSYGRLRLLRVL